MRQTEGGGRRAEMARNRSLRWSWRAAGEAGDCRGRSWGRCGKRPCQGLRSVLGRVGGGPVGAVHLELPQQVEADRRPACPASLTAEPAKGRLPTGSLPMGNALIPNAGPSFSLPTGSFCGLLYGVTEIATEMKSRCRWNPAWVAWWKSGRKQPFCQPPRAGRPYFTALIRSKTGSYGILRDLTASSVSFFSRPTSDPIQP